MAETKRSKYLRRWAALKNERSSWFAHWREISDYLLPRQGRFFVTDRNQGKKRHNNILDSTATKALNTLAAGMMAGMSSPARPWFRLGLGDKKLMEREPVKLWLFEVAELMRQVFAKSNSYRVMHSTYKELGAFGTGGAIILPDFENVIHQHPMTIGEYAIATDHRGQVNAMYREFDMTVAAMVEDFGIDNVSTAVADAFRRGNLDHWQTVIHLIEPRKQRDTTKRDAKNMPIASIYLEASGNDDDKLLRESGFKQFPGVFPRWDVAGGDIYGNGPGMESLGDVRQLQHQQLRKATAIDYQANPPLQLPTAMRNAEHDLLPGGVSYYDAAAPGGGVRSAFDVNLRLDFLLADIQDVRTRIRETFYADLFLLLANDTRSNITAREVAERHEEKLLMLGPVLDRLHNEMLGPEIDVVFDRIVEAGILPPPPPEVEGADLNIEFVSMLAQAQRAVGTGAVDRLLGTIASVAQFKPDVLDKLDGDQLVDKYADMLGVDPDIILADDKVALIRADRAKMQQAQQAMAAAPAMAQTAKDLAAADTEGENALTALTRQFTQL